MAAAVEVEEEEEEEVMEGEDQFGLTSINIDIFLSQFNQPHGLPDYSLPPIFVCCNVSVIIIIIPHHAIRCMYFIQLTYGITGYTKTTRGNFY